MSTHSWIRACAPLALVVVILAGCSGPPWRMPAMKGEVPAPKTLPKTGQTQVRTAGDGFALGDVDQPACTAQQFVDRLSETLRLGQEAAADRWVHRYPDVALAILRDPPSVQASPDLLVRLAQAHDRQCSRVAPNAGWAALMADRAARAEVYAAYEQRRRQFLTQIQSGHAKEALQLGLTDTPAGVPGVMLQIDALRLTGIAQVLENRPQDAVTTFDKGLAVAQGHPYQATSLLLLVSDAQRRAGNAGAAQQSWNRAAALAAEMVVTPCPTIDPILWERLAYLRPADSRWPVEVSQRLADLNLRYGIVANPRQPVVPVSTAPAANEEATLWVAIGHWRLGRDEPQAALVALKRAESSTSDTYTADRLQLAQTRALIRLGQTGPANAILLRLGSSADPRTANPALAMLGTLKLQQGGVQQGFNLLRRAVEGDASIQWPERADAEADLGLAYLLMGDEQAGLHWLHSAQQAWEAAGRQESLVQCLENEAAYLDQVKKKELAEVARRRIEALKRS